MSVINLSQAKILIVEDDFINRELYKTILSSEYYTLFNTGESNILELISRTNPTIVILDLLLPGEYSGLDILKLVRESYSGIILIVTALSDRATMIECLKSGADDYITKPIQVAHFKKLIAAYVRKSLI